MANNKIKNRIAAILEEQGFNYEGIILVQWMHTGRKRVIQRIQLTPQAYKDLGINPHEWHQIIRNIKQPDMAQAQCICVALGVSMAEMYNNQKIAA